LLHLTLLRNSPEYHRRAFLALCAAGFAALAGTRLFLHGTLLDAWGAALAGIAAVFVLGLRFSTVRLAYPAVYAGGTLLLVFLRVQHYSTASIVLGAFDILLAAALLLRLLDVLLLGGAFLLAFFALPYPPPPLAPAAPAEEAFLLSESLWLGAALLTTLWLYFLRLRRAEEDISRLRTHIADLTRLNENILQNTSDGVAIQSLDGAFTFISETGAALLGYTPDELIGSDAALLVPPDQMEIIRQADQRRQQGITDRYEVQLFHKEGRRVDVLITGSPYYENGRLCGYFSVFTDVSPVRQAQRDQENTFQRLQILHEIDRSVLDARSPMEIASAVLPYLEKLLPIDRASVVQYDFTRNLALILSNWERHGAAPIPVQIPLDQFAASPALSEGHVRIIPDLKHATESKLHNASPIEYALLQQGYRSIANIPLFGHEKKLIGVLNMAARLPQAFSSEHLHIAEEIATSLALAIQQSLLLHAEQQQRRLAETLREVTASLSSSLDLDEVLGSILSCAAEVLPYDSANILLCEKDGFRMIACKGTPMTEQPIAFDALPYLHNLLEERTPKIIPDTLHAPLWKPTVATDAVRAWMGIPLLAHGEVIGVLNLHRNHPMAYAHADARLAATFAIQAALAIRNARLFQAEQRRRMEMETLRQASMQMTSNLDLQSTLEGILSFALRISQGYDAHIFLYDGKKLHFGAAMWASKSQERAYQEPRPDGITYTTVRRREKIVVPDFSTHPLYLATGWKGAIISLPLSIGEHIIGVMNVAHRQPHEFDEHEIHALELLADQAAIALENSRLYTQLQTQFQRLSVLRTIDRAITASMDLNLTLSILLEQITAQPDVDAAVVWLLTPMRTLRVAARRGLKTSALRASTLRLGESPVGRAALTRSTIVYPTPQDWPASQALPPYYAAYCAIPLVAKGTLLGVLEAFRQETPANVEDWLDFVEAIAGQTAIAIDNATLFSNLQQSNTRLVLAYEATLEGWARALELRDQETEGHTRRVTALTIDLAERMGIPPEQMIHIRRGALLHDIGKMGIPDDILLKAGPLTPEERTVMETHPRLARDLLAQIPFLQPALDIPYCHHEKWDGSGYPRGLKGEEIPLSARIFAVVDVWDALTSGRPYRPAWSKETTRNYILEQSGQHFDPAVVETFLTMLEERGTFETEDGLPD